VPDFVRRGLCGRQRQIGDNDFCALFRIFDSDFLADAAGGAGDQRDFIVQQHSIPLRIV
jgi:hypothetical protein